MSILIWLIAIVFVIVLWSCFVVRAQADRDMERLMEEEKRKNE